MSDLPLFEAIHTARSLRRLTDEPVPEALITRVLDAAVRAPTGGNAQNWFFMVVRDAEKRRKLGAVYRKASDEVSEIYAARGRPPHMTEEKFQRFLAAGAYLWDHLGDAPVLLIPCLVRRDMPPREALPKVVADRYEAHLAYQDRIRGASIYPAVQNIILACRGLGLGTLITTNRPAIRRRGCRCRARHAARGLYLRADAGRVSAGEIRASGSQAADRGCVCRHLGQPLAGRRSLRPLPHSALPELDHPGSVPYRRASRCWRFP